MGQESVWVCNPMTAAAERVEGGLALRVGKANRAADRFARLDLGNAMMAGGRHQALLRSLLDVHQERGRTAVLREAAALLNRTLRLESVAILRHVGGGNHAFR